MGTVVIIAFFTDVLWRRIPNKLMLAGVVCQSINVLYHEGIMEMLFCMLKGIAVMGSLFILYIIKGMGAGDIKLFGFIGMLCGIKKTFQVFEYSIILCGLYVMVESIIKNKSQISSVRKEIILMPFILIGLLITMYYSIL